MMIRKCAHLWLFRQIAIAWIFPIVVIVYNNSDGSPQIQLHIIGHFGKLTNLHIIRFWFPNVHCEMKRRWKNQQQQEQQQQQ